MPVQHEVEDEEAYPDASVVTLYTSQQWHERSDSEDEAMPPGGFKEGRPYYYVKECPAVTLGYDACPKRTWKECRMHTWKSPERCIEHCLVHLLRKECHAQVIKDWDDNKGGREEMINSLATLHKVYAAECSAKERTAWSTKPSKKRPREVEEDEEAYADAPAWIPKALKGQGKGKKAYKAGQELGHMANTMMDAMSALTNAVGKLTDARHHQQEQLADEAGPAQAVAETAAARTCPESEQNMQHQHLRTKHSCSIVRTILYSEGSDPPSTRAQP
eukprot:TRINITY_DN26567_c0_g1_i3.p2 TRINITY_DN26567_c0_g1~~TRINITY_DN26567_c0_g1_i3.p2  ORF type:complete len:275 (+),score=72.24 TRINITY_DN26567_c0_g1_i3:122-946(+)